MSKKELKKLSQKFLNGTATVQEKQLLHKWYDTACEGAVENVETNTPETEQEIKQRIFNAIQKEMHIERDPAFGRNRYVISINRLLVQAASVAAVFLIGLLIWNFNSNKSSVPAAVKQLVSISPNKIIHITLPDGSKVWLKPGSVLKYPSKFEGKLRLVELQEGHAFFDIKHETEHPFIVKTQNLNITVLGTSFDVRSYKKEGNTKVSVVTGKVGITLPNERSKPAIMLVAKQRVIVCAATSQVVKMPVREAVVNLWCKEPLVFDQQDLSNVFKAIEKKYNTKITIENKELLNEHVTITLGNQRLDTIMQILSWTKNFNYKIANDSTVVIK